MSKQRLGEHLVQEGRLQPQQLQRALDLQRQLGGRLGTNLLEIGAVGEGQLLQALGEQRATRTATAEDLRQVTAELIQQIPAKLARRYRLVPYRREGKTLFLASVNVGDVLIEDEIRMLTGCMVRTTLALELRVQEALGKYYRVPADVRITSLVRRLASGSAASAAPLTTPPPVASPSPIPSAPGPAAVRPSRVSEPVDPARRQPSATSGVSRPAPPSPVPSTPAPSSPAPPSPVASAATVVTSQAETTTQPAVQFIELDAEDEALLRGRSPAPPEEQAVVMSEQPVVVSEQPIVVAEQPVATPATVQSPPEAAPVRMDQVAQPLPPAFPEPEDELAVFGAPDLEPEERLGHAAELLQHAEIRDDIADVLLAFCAPYLERRLLLIQKQENIVGWRGDGPGLVREAIRGIEIGRKEPSVFLSVQPPSGFWLGPLPPLPPNQRLLDGLGQFVPKDCLVLPVVLRSKVVCYLYGDNGGRGVAGVPVGDLRRLMAKAGVAFEVYILKNKIRLM